MEVRFRLEFERQVVEPCDAFKPFITIKTVLARGFFLNRIVYFQLNRLSDYLLENYFFTNFFITFHYYYLAK